MALECNIDRRGRQVRLAAGVLLVLAACLVLLAWALPSGSRVFIAACLLGVGAGAFMIFEGLAGWCWLRAMGVRTPI